MQSEPSRCTILTAQLMAEHREGICGPLARTPERGSAFTQYLGRRRIGFSAEPCAGDIVPHLGGRHGDAVDGRQWYTLVRTRNPSSALSVCETEAPTHMRHQACRGLSLTAEQKERGGRGSGGFCFFQGRREVVEGHSSTSTYPCSFKPQHSLFRS